jgi:hypothetical protein
MCKYSSKSTEIVSHPLAIIIAIIIGVKFFSFFITIKYGGQLKLSFRKVLLGFYGLDCPVSADC